MISTTNTNSTKYIFLYYTAAQMQDGEDTTQGKQPLGNVVYRYELANTNSRLINPKLLLNLLDTENGVVFGDEVNLVEPGFNSGWNKIDGIWLRGYPIEDTEDKAISPSEEEQANNLLLEGLAVLLI
jgi:hypothetical protein